MINGLHVAVPRYTTAVAPDAVIQAGATGLNIVATSPAVLDALREAYADAIRRTIILGLAGICMVVPLSCAMEWVNIKHVAEKRLQTQQSGPLPAEKGELSDTVENPCTP